MAIFIGDSDLPNGISTPPNEIFVPEYFTVDLHFVDVSGAVLQPAEMANISMKLIANTLMITPLLIDPHSSSDQRSGHCLHT